MRCPLQLSSWDCQTVTYARKGSAIQPEGWKRLLYRRRRLAVGLGLVTPSAAVATAVSHILWLQWISQARSVSPSCAPLLVVRSRGNLLGGSFFGWDPGDEDSGELHSKAPRLVPACTSTIAATYRTWLQARLQLQQHHQRLLFKLFQTAFKRDLGVLRILPVGGTRSVPHMT